MIISLINLALSPFCLLVFFFITFGKESRYFTPDGTNVNKLKPLPYLIYTIIYVGVVLLLTSFWLHGSGAEISLWEVFIPEYYWVSGLCWLVTLFTIITYVKGMEGNIMGFIFFPMLLVSCFVLAGVNFTNILSYNWVITGPIIQMDIWIRVVLHAFMPLYLLSLTSSENKNEPFLQNGLAILITSLIMQLILFGLHWIVLYFFDKTFSFSVFFGEGQNVYYYLPSLAGFIYLIFYSLSGAAAKEKGTKAIKFFKVVCFLMLFAQLINYISFVKVLFDK